MKSLKYAKRMSEAKPSFIRESLKLSSLPGIISFAGGNPDAEYFPGAEIEEASSAVLKKDWRGTLQYSITEGNVGLREMLLKKMEAIGVKAELDELVILNGSQQGLDLTGKVFLDPDDVVILESPSYMGAINAFKFYQPRFVGVDMDENGIVIADLERKLQENPGTKYIYTVPDFQNPTGRVLARERRPQMVELAERYDVLIVEDNPYYALRFEGEAIPPIKHYDRDGRVIYLGSLSKELCPALRLGWMVADKNIVSSYVTLKQGADLHTNELSQRIAAEYLQRGYMEDHLTLINREYKKKKDLMLEKIRDLFPKCIQNTVPKGGLFIWLTLPEGWDAMEIFQQAYEKEKVIFIPGNTFYPYGGHDNTLRLSYATSSLENISEGMERLARVFNERLNMA